jgi:ABC-type branched-subunit amino acid transport system ATPase component
VILNVDNVTANRGESRVLHGVSLDVDEGEMVALIGRNGMGKTTLLRSVMGLSEVVSGTVTLTGEDVTRMPSHEIARRGIGVVPEGRGIFPSLTVAENLRMGLSNGKGVDDRLVWVRQNFPAIADRMSDQGGSLSGGQQQILAIARALIAEPRLLLVDEFSEGIQPSIVQEIGEMLTGLVKQGVSLLLVEQNARFALTISDRAYILEKGAVAASGPAKDLLKNKKLLSEHLVV